LPEPSTYTLLIQMIAGDLDLLHVPYLVIGGQAVLQYGEPRFTQDIDITLAVGTDKLSTLLQLAAERGWRVLPENPEVFVERTMVLPCVDTTTGIRLDFIFSTSPYERQAIARAKNARSNTSGVCYASVEDVVIQKIFAGRPRDLEDVRTIILKNRGMDLEYVRNWLKELGSAMDEDYLNTFENIRQSTAR
jgi:hypothetical protein